MKKTVWMWLVLAGCGVDEGLYNARVADLNRTKAEMDKVSSDGTACQKKAADLEAENAAVKQHLQAMGQDVSSLTATLDETKRKFEEMQRQHDVAEKRAQTYRDLVAKLKSMIDAGQLQVETREGRMIVKMSDQILFDPGQTKIKPAGEAALKQLAAVLAQIANRSFQVAGHTDNTPIKSGKYKSNWELSTARAVEVVRFLAQSGMDGKRLSAAGYADNSPVDTNDTPEGRAKNRRIEVVLQPNVEEMPKID